MPTVLVIDDQKEALILIKTVLGTRNIDTLTAVNAKKGIEVMRTHMPDLVFMDLLLPEIDGFKAIEIIKADDDLKHIPIIAITAASIANAHERLRTVGADAFIAKPFKIPQLLDLAESFL